MSVPEEYYENYEPTTDEVVKLLGGDNILWNTSESLSVLFTLSLDPLGDFPSLDQLLEEERKN